MVCVLRNQARITSISESYFDQVETSTHAKGTAKQLLIKLVLGLQDFKEPHDAILFRKLRNFLEVRLERLPQFGRFRTIDYVLW